ncbi:PRTRC system protein B [Pedobacter fastidiosus]|uniref:PRTRC system protein B n=1 Tax=Pedobacter fastidiosus TaxID=2765361 RepID=A0ABR7KYU5_9SPHI|nr:PRTRC system protein B [Pedobacter fastidiosus]MBC6113200.1 PRTRC system protein B [Pedobacter fastidiosus]
MKNINESFEKTYDPFKAILFYKSAKDESFYVEGYDMDFFGKPINAHPLSLQESHALSDALADSEELKQGFLQCRSILAPEVLFINSDRDGYVLWYTHSVRQNLSFKKDLSIDDGEANLPPLLWKASKQRLSLWALAKDGRPVSSSTLYYAPFFNIYQNGEVCMGNVAIEIDINSSLEGFMESWQNYFFKSAFSHLLGDSAPTKTNIVQLWQSLVSSEKPFPIKTLKKYPKTLKDLI